MNKEIQQASYPPRQEVDLIDIVMVLWKRKNTIIVSVIGTLLFVVSILSGLISFEQNKKVILTSSIQVGYITYDKVFYQTHNSLMSVAESKDLLEGAIIPTTVATKLPEQNPVYKILQENTRENLDADETSFSVYLICSDSGEEFFTNVLDDSIEELMELQNGVSVGSGKLTPSTILRKTAKYEEPEKYSAKLIGIISWIVGIVVGIIAGLAIGCVAVFFIETIAQAKSRLNISGH